MRNVIVLTRVRYKKGEFNSKKVNSMRKSGIKYEKVELNLKKVNSMRKKWIQCEKSEIHCEKVELNSKKAKSKSIFYAKMWNQMRKSEFNVKKWTVYFQCKIPLCEANANSLMIQFKHSEGKRKTEQIWSYFNMKPARLIKITRNTDPKIYSRYRRYLT